MFILFQGSDRQVNQDNPQDQDSTVPELPLIEKFSLEEVSTDLLDSKTSNDANKRWTLSLNFHIISGFLAFMPLSTRTRQSCTRTTPHQTIEPREGKHR